MFSPSASAGTPGESSTTAAEPSGRTATFGAICGGREASGTIAGAVEATNASSRVAILTVQIFVQHAWSVRNASNILDAEVPTTKKACGATAGSECHSDSLYVLYTATFTADAQQQTVRIPSKQHAYKPLPESGRHNFAPT